MASPAWPSETVVPSLHQLDGSALASEEMARLLHILCNEMPVSVSMSMESPHPVQPWSRALLPDQLQSTLATLRERCGERALDAWMATLLRSWLQDLGTGTARKIRWVVPAAAVLGGDACAALIGPHMRGENYEMRCTGEVGVAALVEMGTRGAMLELAHLARKFPAKMRGQGAQRALQSIATAQGLTADQLQDRILPDGGLDAMGRRSFDYGPRQFDLVLDEHLTPALRAADGRRITSLPKPNSKDDAVRAAEARAEWKVAKAHISRAAQWLAARFEGAMVTGETWSGTEFRDLFRRHPLARHVVRRLLWSATAAHYPSIIFRVAEDDTLADVSDAQIELTNEAIRVRPIHPLELDANVREPWQRVFADYQIVSPFQQLDRAVFRVSPTDAVARAITTFPHPQYEVKSVVFPLESRGWARDPHADNGTLTFHSRSFQVANMTAYLEYDPGAFLGDILGSGLQRLTRLYFVTTGRRSNDALRLGDVPPIVFSETLRDIHALVPAI